MIQIFIENLSCTGIVPDSQDSAVNKANGDHCPHRAFVLIKEKDKMINK